jgi:hypothetical protein
MGTIVVKNAVERKPGFMYYINGKGDVCEAKMSHGNNKKKSKTVVKKVKVVKKVIAKKTAKKIKKK